MTPTNELFLSKWDNRFIALADFVSHWSKDPRTRVGAVLVGADKREVALGYNGLPPGVEDDPERLADRATKHQLIMHAERNVLDNAHFETRGGVLYTTKPICPQCAGSAISYGIHRVVQPRVEGDEDWAASAKLAQQILNEAFVEVQVFQWHG